MLAANYSLWGRAGSRLWTYFPHCWYLSQFLIVWGCNDADEKEGMIMVQSLNQYNFLPSCWHKCAALLIALEFQSKAIGLNLVFFNCPGWQLYTFPLPWHVGGSSASMSAQTKTFVSYHHCCWPNVPPTKFTARVTLTNLQNELQLTHRSVLQKSSTTSNA